MNGVKPGRPAFGFGFAWVLVIAASAESQPARQPPFFEYAQIDPHKVVTAEKCGECHIQEAEVWKRTPHATGFKTLHKKEQAETIAKKMGFRLIKRDSLCFSCHYTPVVQSGKIRVVSGVSCESCHGAGADYLDIHNVYGEGFDHDSEPPGHRRTRIADSRRAGMRRPSDLYPVAANCFSCHTVPLERLVNQGGHTTGSGGFELVEWTQGEIRHNFLKSSLDGADPVNVERSMSRKRVIYVVGRALDLEYSVRGLAKARTDGIYAKAMSRRVRSAVSELRAISRFADIPEVDDMMRAVKSVKMVPRNESELLAVADRVQKATRAFLAKPAPSSLASIDDLVRGIDPEPEGEEGSFEVAEGAVSQPVEGGEPGASGGVSGSTPSGSGGSGATTGPSTGPLGGTTATSASRTTKAIGARGPFKTRIRPASSHRTIGPGNCSGCHSEQNRWWFGHAHSKSVDPFFDGQTKNLQIARLYGVKLSAMTTGRAVCMDCHGTIVSGKESREVLDGVSCESCHGAAADWLEPHKNEAGKELGRRRPGHLAALELGKADLRQMRKRAETCTGCHYITEPRLLSAGHPSGAGFDYVKGMNGVRHWQQRMPDTEIASATRAVVASRGPVPRVQVASLPDNGPDAVLSARVAARAATGRSTALGGSGGSTGSRNSAGSAVSGLSRSARSARSGNAFAAQRRAEAYVLRPPAPRPVVFSRDSGGERDAVVLPAFPDLAGATIEEVLLAVQQRLKLLYRLVDPTNPRYLNGPVGPRGLGGPGAQSGGSR